jgi:hypothetical protein
LLRDLRRGEAPDIAAVIAVLARVAPDIVVLQGVDYDADGLALSAVADRLREASLDLPHGFADRPNAGLATGLDMDGDGRLGGPRDAQGYGRFAGHGAMAVLSRHPIDTGAARSFTDLLWRDLPGAIPPRTPDGAPFPDAERFARQRLSSVAHWDLPVILPDGRRIHLLTWHGTPPVFDGPEDRNGRRNHDETALWLRYLDGALDLPPPEAPLVVLGVANIDPLDGEGRPEALRALLAHPRLQDPAPRSDGGAEAARIQGGANDGQAGDPARDTADWDDAPGGPGNLRVSYILPSRDWRVLDGGVVWPRAGTPEAALPGEDAEGTRHRLVWVDLTLD